jgi:hypothetical protein
VSDLIIRDATRADNDALIDLERRSPLLLGETTLTFDRSPNFFARDELMECSRMLVAEKDGQPAGVMGIACYDTLVGGEPVRAAYVHHGRVPAEHQRSGVAMTLALALLEPLLTKADLLYWYVSPENQISLNLIVPRAPHRWPRDPVCQRFLLEPQPVAAKGRPTPARPEQIGEICKLINRTHAGRDLFMPYTEGRLAARLSRSQAYGWPHIFVRERRGLPVAVAGLWDLGATLKLIRAGKSGEATACRPGFILDYGFEEGAEGEMTKLLDDLRGLAAALGRQELWIAMDPDSRLCNMMSRRPHVVESFLGFNITPDAPRPGRTATPYLDPVYW